MIKKKFTSVFFAFPLSDMWRVHYLYYVLFTYLLLYCNAANS